MGDTHWIRRPLSVEAVVNCAWMVIFMYWGGLNCQVNMNWMMMNDFGEEYEVADRIDDFSVDPGDPCPQPLFHFVKHSARWSGAFIVIPGFLHIMPYLLCRVDGCRDS